MKNTTFYHDGCTICADTGKELVNLIGLSGMDVVHVGLNPSKMSEARERGVKCYPALVTRNGNVLHFNVEEHEGSFALLNGNLQSSN